MSLRTGWLQELRWPEVEAHLGQDDVALIPIGATEQHGRHLPMLVDTGWAVAACEIAARRMGVIVAPPLPYGWSPHHMGFPGTVTLRADTLRALATDVAESLIHHGFRRIVFVNGNRIANLPPLDIAAVEIKNRTGAHVAVVDTGLIARREVAALCEAGGLDHAGVAETAFALHWAPGDVDLAAARPAAAEAAASRFGWPIELDPARTGNSVSTAVSPAEHRAATAPDGVSGDPTTATAEQGRAMVEAIGANLAAFIAELRARPIGPVAASVPV